MKKILLVFLLLGYLPYLFLATSVEKAKDNKNREYLCTASKPEHYKQSVALGMVHYDFNMKFSKTIVLPYFFIEGDVFFADCGTKTFPIGRASFLNPGDRLQVFTSEREVKFFGKTVLKEESIDSFSNYSEKQ